MELNFTKIENDDYLNIDLIKSFSAKTNEKDEINSINFSYDEKYLLVLINKNIIHIYEINSGKIIQSSNQLKDIN